MKVDCVIIGAGQAGLATSFHLTQLGREHVVLEQARVAESWRSGRWDSFCLVTPNWTVQLPGSAYGGPDADGFMSKDEVIGYLDRYAEAFRPPARTGVHVDLVRQTTDGQGFEVVASETTFEARDVVIAVGSYQRGMIPDLAASLPPSIYQLHSSDYRNPGQVPAGKVLVVGTGQSGCQIAEELHQAGRDVFLSVGRCPRIPRRYRGKDALWWGVRLGQLDRTVDTLKSRAEKFACHPHVSGKRGGHGINLRQFAHDGIILVGRVTAAGDGTLALAADLSENLRKADEFAESLLAQLDVAVAKLGLSLPPDENVRGIGAAVPHELDPIREFKLRDAGITSIIWATGYQFDFSWIQLPVFDAAGYPVQHRGVTAVRGLYFVGLEWLYKAKSGLLLGVGEDAAYIASTMSQAWAMEGSR